MDEKPFFTAEELAYIDKELGFIVQEWETHIIGQIIRYAKDAGVSRLFWNSSDTLSSGATQDAKVEHFYEKLPPRLGFRETTANLRGKGEERLWYLDLVKRASYFNDFIRVAEALIPLEKIPREYQGAFINLFKKKPFYTQEELKRVIELVKERESKKKKPISRLWYEDKGEWSGAQRFKDDVVETIVTQRLTKAQQDIMLGDPVFRKFWAFLLSQAGHFGPDVLGFALISKISKDIWVINEIQTDCINAYMKIRNQVQRHQSKGEDKKMSWETIKDMLQAQNRSNWITRLEVNEQMKQQLIQNPQMIHQLPDNSVNIDEWIAQQRGQGAVGQPGLDLMRHFQSVNMNVGIFRV